MKAPTEINIAKFVQYRNINAKVIKLAKKLYYEKNLQKYQCNAKKTWELLRKATGSFNKKKTNNSIGEIMVDGITLSNPKDIAEKFNEFFSNIASKIVEEIHPAPEIPPDPGELAPSLDMYHSFSFSREPLTHEIISAIFKANLSLKPTSAAALVLGRRKTPGPQVAYMQPCSWQPTAPSL